MTVEAGNTNVSTRLNRSAEQFPQSTAIAVPATRNSTGRRSYTTCTFQELDAECTALAGGLHALGVRPGTRLALLVRPGIEFIALTFAMLKAGAVIVLIDPGMGRKNLIGCLQAVEPEGFVTIPLVHAVRTLLGRRFPRARYNVTLGRRWFWNGVTLDQLRALGKQRGAGCLDGWEAASDDPAAIIFTTGSTGPPKGVLYRHGNFSQQVDELRDFYQIQPGEIDLPGFPLFALFNCAMGVTTVIPDMDPTRPAQVNPRHIVEAIQDWQVTQAFGSPALWNVVARHCEKEQVQLPSLRRVLSAGAPVPPHVLRTLKTVIASEGDVHTPYGATESLPVSSIAASEILDGTEKASQCGAGTCVGKPFPGIDWRVIGVSDSAITCIEESMELPNGEIGELIVCGGVVTTEYVTRREVNALSKIHDGERLWHRMGDVGYLDEQNRFWFCGRKAHRVITNQGTLYTVPCEAVFNTHPAVSRSALVGIGPPGRQTPVLIVEPFPDQMPRKSNQRRRFTHELKTTADRHEHTNRIDHFLFHPSFPVDIRHNAKIFREKLAVWARKQLDVTS
ncbi:MAG: peptide synthase [Planctomycetaceae bacterium]|nr:peptide synthase [Planctomycetaceae bacterium]MBP60195.1 peptide synthase [Planctomycetaceae bacterium]